MGTLSSVKVIIRFALLAFLCVFALLDFSRRETVRRTFLFYTFDRGRPVVESRMLPRLDAPEREIALYVEEALLGPVSLSLAPLLDKEARLRALLFRDGTVYADFAWIAALPVSGAKTDAVTGLTALERGIRRNFPAVRDVKFFIEGNEIFL
jgi:hypothetical protein